MQQTYETIVKHNLKAKTITATDAEMIKGYIADRMRMNKVKSAARGVKIASTMCTLRAYKLIPAYANLKTDDILNCFVAVRTAKTIRGVPYSQNSQREIYNSLKTYARWAVRNKGATLDLEKIKEYEAPKAKKDSVKPSDVLDDDKINRMIDFAQTPRDKALITLMAETGARPKEVTRLKWHDLEFTDKSIRVRLVDAKDETKWKMAFITKRKSYLVDLRKSQAGDAETAFVFRCAIQSNSIRLSDRPLLENTIRQILARITADAGITLPKGAKCKILRASSVTNKLKAGVAPIAIMKSHWSSGGNSKMFEHYEKLASVDTENMMLSADGQPVDNRPAKVNPASVGFVCIKCNHSNPAGANFCQNCGSSPDASDKMAALEKELAEIKALMAAVVKNNSKN